MAGNVAEWTSTAYEDDAVAFIHDKQPDLDMMLKKKIQT
jgi:hypothetical protein